MLYFTVCVSLCAQHIFSVNSGKEVSIMSIIRLMCILFGVLAIFSFVNMGYAALEEEKQGGGIQRNAVTKLRFTPEMNFTKASAKDMLDLYDFFCQEHPWSKGYSNIRGHGFDNGFEVREGGEVVYDHASGLMWQKSGSYEQMDYDEVNAYVDQLNHNQFAGYNDWRLPTVEEAMSLMEPTENNDRLYVDSVFDKNQMWIWTSDSYSASSAWTVDFSSGCYYYYNDFTSSYVRAVR